jgi:uncharacterized protein (DUF885 family)
LPSFRKSLKTDPKYYATSSRAEKELSAKFDIRAFHDEMLNGGVLPLDLLDKRTDQWIQGQKAGVQ